MVRLACVVAVISSFLIVASASAAQSNRSTVDSTRKGPVKKLVELERRKNEWLREKMGR